MNAGMGVIDPDDNIVHALDANGQPVSTDSYGGAYPDESSGMPGGTDSYGGAYPDESSYVDEGMYDDIQTQDTGAWSNEGIDMEDMDPQGLAAAGM